MYNPIVLNRLKNSNIAPYLGVFSFLFLCFFFMYFHVGTLAGGDDQFFHFRFAYEIKQNGFLESFHNFKSIFFSKMAQGDYYFLYYNFIFFLVIIPFTFIEPLFLGIKLYGVLSATLSFTLIYAYLKKLKINNAFWFILFGIASVGSGLLFRFFTSRPFVLAPAFLLFLLLALHKKRYFWVGALSFLYLFWHSSTFFFTICVTAVYAVFEAFYGKRVDYRNILWSIFGTTIAIGMCYLINSDFLMFIYDTVFGIYKETILGQAVNIPEGVELYKTDFMDFIKNNSLFTISLVISIFIFVSSYIKDRISNLDTTDDASFEGSIFFLTISFFLGTVAVSARFADFLVYFGIVFSALILSKLLKLISVDKSVSKSVYGGISVSISYLFLASLFFVQSSIANSASPDGMRQVGEWINKNVNQKTVVFNTSWNWFPQLYYYAPNNYYISGLEPRFMYAYNHGLYWRWSHISNDGYLCDSELCPISNKFNKLSESRKLTNGWYEKQGNLIANSILNNFESKYVITSSNYKNLISLMDHSSRFGKQLETNNGYYIYKVFEK